MLHDRNLIEKSVEQIFLIPDGFLVYNLDSKFGGTFDEFAFIYVRERSSSYFLVQMNDVFILMNCALDLKV